MAYTGTYAVTDIDDIVIDGVGIGGVEVIRQLPTLVQITILVMIVGFLTVLLAAAINLFVKPAIMASGIAKRLGNGKA